MVQDVERRRWLELVWWIQGEKSDGIIEIKDFKIKGGKMHGLFACGGMNVVMRNVSVEEFDWTGMIASGADIFCNNLQVVGCGLMSGVGVTSNATIRLSG